MKNLINILQQAKDEYSIVELSEIHNLLDSVSKEQSNIEYDWDEWSGEEWLTLSIKNDKIAIIGVKIPIAFISINHHKCVQSFDLLKKMKNVIINDFDESIWFMDLTEFQHLFAELEWHASRDAVDPKTFSTNDFWFATI